MLARGLTGRTVGEAHSEHAPQVHVVSQADAPPSFACCATSVDEQRYAPVCLRASRAQNAPRSHMASSPELQNRNTNTSCMSLSDEAVVAGATTAVLDAPRSRCFSGTVDDRARSTVGGLAASAARADASRATSADEAGSGLAADRRCAAASEEGGGELAAMLPPRPRPRWIRTKLPRPRPVSLRSPLASPVDSIVWQVQN